MLDLDELLVKMEEHMHNAKKPIIGKGVIVDQDYMYDLIDKMRDNLPDVIREANHIVNNREAKEQELELKAQRILNEATERANRMLNDHSISLRAEENADLITRQAHEYKDKIYAYVKNEINKLLNDTESELNKVFDIINAAKDKNNNYLFNV